MRLRRYPFLVSLNDFSERELGFRVTLRTLASDPLVSEAALSALEAAISGSQAERKPASTEEAVLSFYLALGLARALGPSVLEAVAKYYADSAAAALALEDEDSLISISKALGLDVLRSNTSIPWTVGRDGRVRMRVLPYAMPVPQYLANAAKSSNTALAFQNQFVLGGLVYLDRRLLSRLLREAFYILIRKRAEALDVDDLAGTRLLEEARIRLERALRARRGLRWDPKALPPCLREALLSIAEGSSVDEQVYLAAAFTGSLGLNEYDLRESLESEPSPEVTVRLRGLVALGKIAVDEGYGVFTCEEARKRGICPAPDACRGPDPLREYFRRLKRLASEVRG